MYKSIDQLSSEDLNNLFFALLEFVIVFHVLVQCPNLQFLICHVISITRFNLLCSQNENGCFANAEEVSFESPSLSYD